MFNWQKLASFKLSWHIFQTRSKIVKHIRCFFENHGFLEIDAPLLIPYPTMDNEIHSLESNISDMNHKNRLFYLHTSPEHAMKKLLVAGADRIFFLGKVFRDRELTHLHNPEFTMLEWYRTQADYWDIQKDAEHLIQYIIDHMGIKKHIVYQDKPINLELPWPCVTVSDLFRDHVNVDLEHPEPLEHLRKSAEALGLDYQKEDDWETLFFRIFLNKIEPKLGFPKPTFVMDYPAELGLMAKRKKDHPNWVERVELYIGGLELANGYSELTDPDEQLKRFESNKKKKKQGTNQDYPIDTELIQALKLGLPPCAGISIGVDRLVMLLLDKAHIQDVLLFPIHEWFK
ncbi:EF-P lysine aminoacylase GenX [bacterium]|nr:EF-P lysine aminoacylase GenX [candidate division CSSED10-310 bacterium]